MSSFSSQVRPPSDPPVAGVAPTSLAGQTVVFTGSLATMSREQASGLVQRAGGRVGPAMTAMTDILVIGMNGWPLLTSGRPTRDLELAEKCRNESGRPHILSEHQFRTFAGLDAHPETEKPLSKEQVCAATGILIEQLDRWEQLGLVRSHASRYDFADVVSLKSVAVLVSQGASPVEIRRSLEQLGAFLPGVKRPLAQLNLLVDESGKVVASIEGMLMTTRGQLRMSFARQPEQSGPESLRLASPLTAADRIDEGYAAEEEGDLVRAESRYREAIALEPNNRVAQFNLGNVLLAQHRPDAAAERFAQAAALDPAHVPSWFNLSQAQEALGWLEKARGSLERALVADPECADACFNLADICERAGDLPAAREAWTRYLQLDPSSAWAAEARRRLRALVGRA